MFSGKIFDENEYEFLSSILTKYTNENRNDSFSKLKLNLNVFSVTIKEN